MKKKNVTAEKPGSQRTETQVEWLLRPVLPVPPSLFTLASLLVSQKPGTCRIWWWRLRGRDWREPGRLRSRKWWRRQRREVKGQEWQGEGEGQSLREEELQQRALGAESPGCHLERLLCRRRPTGKQAVLNKGLENAQKLIPMHCVLKLAWKHFYLRTAK